MKTTSQGEQNYPSDTEQPVYSASSCKVSTTPARSLWSTKIANHRQPSLQARSDQTFKQSVKPACRPSKQMYSGTPLTRTLAIKNKQGAFEALVSSG